MNLRRSLFAVGLISLTLLWTPPSAQSQDNKDKPTAPAAKDLTKRLKELEDEAGKIRQAMLKEIDAEGKKIEEQLKQAKDEEDKANKAKDRATAAKARETVMKLRQSQFQLSVTRGDIERRFNIGVPAAVKTPTEEERLGIHTTVPSSTLVNQLGLIKEQGTVGMVLDRVAKDSPAAKAGFQVHDVLVQLDGKPVPSDTAKFKKLLSEIKPGTGVEAVVLRKGKQHTIAGVTIPPVSQQAATSDAATKAVPPQPTPQP